MKQLYLDIITQILNNLDVSKQWACAWVQKGQVYPDIAIDSTEFDEKLQRYYNAERINYVETEQNKSFYAPDADTIVLPLKRQFKSASGYFAVKAHETIHSTGDYIRCDREGFDEYKSVKFGDSTYSKEELTAELGACFLLAEMGIDTTQAIENASVYVSHWISKLNNNPKWVFKTAELAIEAVEYILEAIE